MQELINKIFCKSDSNDPNKSQFCTGQGSSYVAPFPYKPLVLEVAMTGPIGGMPTHLQRNQSCNCPDNTE